MSEVDYLKKPYQKNCKKKKKIIAVKLKLFVVMFFLLAESHITCHEHVQIIFYLKIIERNMKF